MAPLSERAATPPPESPPMEPMMFGTSEAPLYGVYHDTAVPARRAALLVPPFGEETIRAHRPFLALATALSAAGVAVLRYDAFGTGNSAGDDRDVTKQTMIDSLLAADDELRAMSQAQKIVWIGLRFGSLVAMAAAEMRPPTRIVGWDAPAHAADHLADLIRRDPSAMRGDGAYPDELLGHPLPPSLAAQMTADWRGPSDETARVTTAAEEDWNADGALSTFRVPVRTISRLTALMAAR
ncbi:hypothetical protein PB2503_10744 [Parvularcula bermudensis HTCC2503]|uniref:Serine aminopeptidase S33 domain-containing protein n=2 Tax=Parvularcula TaxID=208215 RepID=E0THB0_PARBH|nr:hypothetical protein PB2503_10744 [Parvularcula bermudensis HTCC2503]